MFAMAWAKEMSSEVYEKSLTTLSNMSSERVELLFNCGRLSELEFKEDYSVFPRFVFRPIILNKYGK